MKRAVLLFFAAVVSLFGLEPRHFERPSLWPRPSPEPVVIREETDQRPFTNNPSGGGLSVDGADEGLHAGTFLTINFPTEMVAADKIDVEGGPSPIEISPAVDVNFIWRTQSQGELVVKGPLMPDQSVPASSARWDKRRGRRFAGGRRLGTGDANSRFAGRRRGLWRAR